MRAIMVSEPGGPEVLVLNEIDIPKPDPGQVLVKLAFAGVNFIDVYFRTGQYPSALPFVPGKEGSGTVVGLGEGVNEFAIGERVAWAMASNSYAEYAVIDAALVVPVPTDIADDIAAAAMLQGLTAHYLTHSIVDFNPGDWVLVHAGAGGVGLVLIQLLKRRGINVITTTSTPEKAALSATAGADLTITYDAFDKQVRAATQGFGVRAVFDGVGRDTWDGSLNSLAPRGAMILFGASSGPVPAFDPQVLNAKGSLMLTRPSLAHFISDRAELLWRANDLFHAIADGVQIHIGQRYQLEDAAQAHRDLAARITTGKLLLSVNHQE